jgi:hypothetical protein
MQPGENLFGGRKVRSGLSREPNSLGGPPKDRGSRYGVDTRMFER